MLSVSRLHALYGSFVCDSCSPCIVCMGFMRRLYALYALRVSFVCSPCVVCMRFMRSGVSRFVCALYALRLSFVCAPCIVCMRCMRSLYRLYATYALRVSFVCAVCAPCVVCMGRVLSACRFTRALCASGIVRMLSACRWYCALCAPSVVRMLCVFCMRSVHCLYPRFVRSVSCSYALLHGLRESFVCAVCAACIIICMHSCGYFVCATCAPCAVCTRAVFLSVCAASAPRLRAHHAVGGAVLPCPESERV